jgi:plasmid segregation protein ParM
MSDEHNETARTETLPEGTLFVSPDGVLYQVVMAGSAGFRKAEPWPWLPHSQGSDAERPGAVALVPGSLLARNYPVVIKGMPLPTVSREDILGPSQQPGHYVFFSERLAKLAAQLDEVLARQSGLAARKERHRWVLSDGHYIFRIYHYQQDSYGMTIDLTARLTEEQIEALPCEQGPSYWQYLPTWKTMPRPPTPPLPIPQEPVVEFKEEAPIAETEEETPLIKMKEEATEATPGPVALEPTIPPARKKPEPQPAVETLSVPPVKQVKRAGHAAPAAPSTSEARRTPAMILSIDIGYGYTKGVGPDNLHFSFPSVIGTAEDIRFAADLIRGGEEKVIKYKDWRFFYGEQAVLQSRIQSTIFDRSRVHDNTYKMLFVAALVELTKFKPNVKRLQVVTGLPVDFFGDRPEVVKSFEGAYRVTADRTIQVTVDSVFVAPQPFGSLFRELLNETGKIANKDVERGRVGIIDVGTFTTDFVVADELRYVQRLSGSARIGWSKVINQVQQALGDLYALELMPHEVDRAVQAQEVRVRGEPVSLEDLVQPAVTDIQTAIIARARDLWGAATNLDVILVSGGGGPYLYDAIQDIYPHALLLDNAFWANVEGLYRFGQRPATFKK